jgi:hypothetical protein
MMLCYAHGAYAGGRCPTCGRVGYNSFYAELSKEVQKIIDAMVDEMYIPDDGTDLQELAAKAYLFGKED